MPYPQDRTIRVGNIQTRYWAEGSLGSPIVLIHGLSGHVENWWPNIVTLAQRHRVYAVDLPGFGRTDKPSGYSYNLDSFVQFIRDFMAAQGLEQVSLVGHSLGAAIALQFTLTFPRLVDRLVMVSSAGLGRAASMMLRVASLPFLGELLTRPSLEGSRSFATGIVFDPSLITEELAQLDYEMGRQPGAQQAFLKCLRVFVNIFGQKPSVYAPLLHRLPSITQPTLVLWGREDPVVPLKHAQAARQIPGSRVQIFDHCGHVPQFEHPQSFDQAVQEFLSD